jgi:hypothetical protein
MTKLNFSHQKQNKPLALLPAPVRPSPAVCELGHGTCSRVRRFAEEREESRNARPRGSNVHWICPVDAFVSARKIHLLV